MLRVIRCFLVIVVATATTTSVLEFNTASKEDINPSGVRRNGKLKVETELGNYDGDKNKMVSIPTFRQAWEYGPDEEHKHYHLHETISLNGVYEDLKEGEGPLQYACVLRTQQCLKTSHCCIPQSIYCIGQAGQEITEKRPGTCQYCKRKGVACSYTPECCYPATNFCIDKTCQQCKHINEPCTKVTDCCPPKKGYALPVVCAGGLVCKFCRKPGQSCFRTSDCCSPTKNSCVKAVCKANSRFRGYVDQSQSPCGAFPYRSRSYWKCLIDSEFGEERMVIEGK